MLVALPAIFFLGMGLFALAWPERVLAVFGSTGLTADGRNEVRAVYGGFGLAVAGAITWGAVDPRLAPGVFAAVGIAVAGIAAGRLYSRALEQTTGPYPWVFFGVEVALAASLLSAARASL